MTVKRSHERWLRWVTHDYGRPKPDRTATPLTITTSVGGMLGGHLRVKRDADRAWRRAEGRIAEGRFLDVRSGRQTFQRYVEGVWLPHHPMEPTTRQGYAYIVGKHLLPEFGRMRMAEILLSATAEIFRRRRHLPTDIRVFLGTLHANGASAATVQRCKTVLGAIFTTALADSVVFLHPCRGVKGPAVGRTPVRILIPAELNRLRDVLPDDRWRLWLDTAIETGAWWGELAELRASDVNCGARSPCYRSYSARTAAALPPPSMASSWSSPTPRTATSASCDSLPRLPCALPTTSPTRGSARMISCSRSKPTPLLTRPATRTRMPPARRRQHRTLVQATSTAGLAPTPTMGAAASRVVRYRASRRAAGKDRPPVPHPEGDPHLSRHWFRKQIWNPGNTAAGLVPLACRCMIYAIPMLRG